jgi:hypothetical protein
VFSQFNSLFFDLALDFRLRHCTACIFFSFLVAYLDCWGWTGLSRLFTRRMGVCAWAGMGPLGAYDGHEGPLCFSSSFLGVCLSALDQNAEVMRAGCRRLERTPAWRLGKSARAVVLWIADERDVPAAAGRRAALYHTMPYHTIPYYILS